MKPFSLEEYLKNPERKIVTRDGRPVRIICTDAKGICPVVGLVAYENYELAFNVMKDGRIDGILDFFFAPEKQKVEKFDVSTLQPFDKVLVRVDKNDCWKAVHFSHEDDYVHKAVCDSFYFIQCIPYNEETKHLVGTSDECPEYYKWWEE